MVAQSHGYVGCRDHTSLGRGSYGKSLAAMVFERDAQPGLPGEGGSGLQMSLWRGADSDAPHMMGPATIRAGGG